MLLQASQLRNIAKVATAATICTLFSINSQASCMTMPSAPPGVPPIEAELMQKIKKKKYLQHDKTGDASSSVAGVPSKLRILAVDLPAFKSMIDRPCSVDNSVVFPDGVVKKKVRQHTLISTPIPSPTPSPPPLSPHPEEQERQYHINATDIFRSVLHEVWRACRGS